MKKQSTWGAFGFLAVAAALGVSLQPGANRGGPSGLAELRSNANPGGAPSGETKTPRKPGCISIATPLELFLDIEHVPEAASCGSATKKTKSGTAQLKFVIATLPDPIHTHLPSIFDHLTEVIQQAAQDEHYLYEASWLPWEDQAQTYNRLPDQDLADDRKDSREKQPGILIFRGPGQANTSAYATQKKDLNEAMTPYREGLIVFVVGEDPTSGIHSDQFKNALSWIAGLKALDRRNQAPTAILGPTFSGSFDSLAKLLSGDGSAKSAPASDLKAIRGDPRSRLAIFSGTANSRNAIIGFRDAQELLDIDFHNFLERDEIGLERYCQYLTNQGISAQQISVISEDETAFGPP